MKEPTMEEVLELVEFDRNSDGSLYVKRVWGDVFDDVCGNVRGSVRGSVFGTVKGSVDGHVAGLIAGREWQFVETPREKAIRLIREGEIEEAIKVLEDEQ